jgi:hypothetical protein
MRMLFGSIENKIKVTKILSLAVSLAGLVVMLGWIFDIPVLKSIRPNWISMKFDTAFCFLLSGISLYLIVRYQEGERDLAQIGLCITSLIIVLLMGVLFFSALLGVHTGAENLFLKEIKVAEKTVIPGRPSLPTMVNFLLVALAGIFAILGVRPLRVILKNIGFVIAAIGSLAIIGYMINMPVLYYYIEGVNSAIAAHAAVLFILLGAGLLCL